MMPRPSILIEQRVQPLHERKDLSARCVAGVILFGDPQDRIHHIGETSATFTAFAERMIDFCGHDKLPAIFVEQRHDRRLDVFLTDVIAVTNDHVQPLCNAAALTDGHDRRPVAISHRMGSERRLIGWAHQSYMSQRINFVKGRGQIAP
jgi:hypothetical protein